MDSPGSSAGLQACPKRGPEGPHYFLTLNTAQQQRNAMTDHVRSDISNGVLTLTLNRPEKKNALTRAMYQALGDGIDAAGQNDEIRCVLIQAEGDMFTAGNDLGDFAAANLGDPDAA